MAGPHFEIQVTDGDRARAFYKGLFGWGVPQIPGLEDRDYRLIEGDGIGMDQGVTGGMMKRIGDAPAAGSPVRGATLTIEVADVDASYAWARANSGAEALPPEDYPGIGRTASVEDGEGNVVSMIPSEEGT